MQREAKRNQKRSLQEHRSRVAHVKIFFNNTKKILQSRTFTATQSRGPLPVTKWLQKGRVNRHPSAPQIGRRRCRQESNRITASRRRKSKCKAPVRVVRARCALWHPLPVSTSPDP